MNPGLVGEPASHQSFLSRWLNFLVERTQHLDAKWTSPVRRLGLLSD